MNDEDTKIKQNDTDSNAREIIANQLDSFINQTNNQNNADVASYYWLNIVSTWSTISIARLHWVESNPRD